MQREGEVVSFEREWGRTSGKEINDDREIYAGANERERGSERER